MNPHNFSRIVHHSKTWLTYSDIFNIKPTREEIIRDIKSIELSEALYILSKLTLLDDESKRGLLKRLNPFISNQEMIESVSPFDLINVLYGVKWFIAYGSETITHTFKNSFHNSFNVFLTILKITDYMTDLLDGLDKAEDQILQSWLFNRTGEIDKVLIRQHEMFQNIARDETLFPTEYIDIHKMFEDEYGYTAQEYVSILFAIQQPFIQKLGLRDLQYNTQIGINNTFFDNTRIKDIGNGIIKDLTVDIYSLKEWARKTIKNPFDYEVFLSTPLFSYKGRILPFSPGYLDTTLFDGLCFKFQVACSKRKKSFFNFFGRLFEEYVSRTIESAVKNTKKVPYTFIGEFSYDKEKKKSSDAYIFLGRSLLIFECKGGRIRKNTKIEADEKIGYEDYTKYALNPIIQADQAYRGILQSIPNRFGNVNKVYILSVALQSFPKIPKYNDVKGIDLTTLHEHVKSTDYISISELELLAYIIENHEFTLFNFIKKKKEKDEYIPYQNYYSKKYGKSKRAIYQDTILTQSIKEIKATLL